MNLFKQFVFISVSQIVSVTLGQERPNILWFVVDDMSANFSCYGEKNDQNSKCG